MTNQGDVTGRGNRLGASTALERSQNENGQQQPRTNMFGINSLELSRHKNQGRNNFYVDNDYENDSKRSNGDSVVEEIVP